MKLKTLKDFRCQKDGCCNRDNCNNQSIRVDGLKQEAIKWVKHGLKYESNFFKVFMEFHNIREEDLK